MDAERTTADNTQRLRPVALLWSRVAASAVLVTGAAWVVYEYLIFQSTLSKVDVCVIAGQSSKPMIVYVVENCGVWPAVICLTGVLGAIIFIWKVAKHFLPILLAMLGATMPCVVAGGIMRIATMDALGWHRSTPA